MLIDLNKVIDLNKELNRKEFQLIMFALLETNGEVSKAAVMLLINRQILKQKIDKLKRKGFNFDIKPKEMI